MLKMDDKIDIHEMVEVVVSILDVRDPYTFEHSWRVSAFCEKITEAMRIPEEWIDTIHVAAHFHDIGKIGVPDNILNKPGPLTEEEFDQIKAHPEIGYRIVSKLPSLRQISLYIRHHHERWDGKGYPAGLHGKDIPIGARIIAVADTFDAITTQRPYREPRSVESALAEIRRVSGSQLCPEVCEVFLGMKDEIPLILASVEREIAVAEGR